jgi:hypothetical protein
MGGAMIVPRSLKAEQNFFFFQDRPNKKKSYMTLLYLLITDFPKFDPLTATVMALYVNLWPKCQILFSVVSD